MIVTNRNNAINTYSPCQNFTSRSRVLKEIGDINRLAKQEFQITSATKLTGYNTFKRKTEFRQYRRYIDNRIGDLRLSTLNTTNTGEPFITNLDALKKFKVGNCDENAESVYTALKMNGIDNAEIMWLYAYNPKTEKIREIDHTVVGVNFKKPENFEYCPIWQMHFGLPEKEHLLSPGNTGIIVDAWSGITEYGKEIEKIYQYDKTLIRHSNEHAKKTNGTIMKTLLEPGEQLYYVPHGKSTKFTEDELGYLRQKYPNMLLAKNKSMSKKTTISDDDYFYSLATEKRKNELRQKFEINKADYNTPSYPAKPKNFIVRLKSLFMKNF